VRQPPRGAARRLLGLAALTVAGVGLFMIGDIGRFNNPRFPTDLRIGGAMRLFGVLVLLLAVFGQAP
jgi:hypothetical protein